MIKNLLTLLFVILMYFPYNSINAENSVKVKKDSIETLFVKGTLTTNDLTFSNADKNSITAIAEELKESNYNQTVFIKSFSKLMNTQDSILLSKPRDKLTLQNNQMFTYIKELVLKQEITLIISYVLLLLISFYFFKNTNKLPNIYDFIANIIYAIVFIILLYFIFKSISNIINIDLIVLNKMIYLSG